MPEELIHVPTSAADSLAALRARLEQAHADARESIAATDFGQLFDYAVTTGNFSACASRLEYDPFIDPRATEAARLHVDAIARAWHALQQAERRALRKP